MEKKFDSIKMWESLIQNIKSEVLYSEKSDYKTDISDVNRWIDDALKDQGFTWDGEHIVPISIEELTHSIPPMEKTKFKEKVNRLIDNIIQNPTEQQLVKEIHSWFEEKQGEQPTAIFYGLTSCTSEEKSELTEFEDALYTTFSDIWQDYMLGKEINVVDFVREHSDELLKIANKQKPAFEMKTPEESLGIDSDTYNKIVDECIYGDDKQKPAAWSKEDDIFFKAIIRDVENIPYISEDAKNDRIKWLKSLRPQNHWKPSGELDEASYHVGIKRVLENPESYGLTKYNWKPTAEQMRVLEWCKPLFAEPESKAILESLIDDLKKLKG